MRACPRFEGCSAPVCPLWPEHLGTVHLRGESICLYLREAVKPGGEALIGGALPDQLAERVLEAVPGIMSRYGTVRRALQRAKRRRSKIAAGRALKKKQGPTHEGRATNTEQIVSLEHGTSAG